MRYYYDPNYHHAEKHSHHILQKILYGLLAIAVGVALAAVSEEAFGAANAFLLT